MQRERWKKNTFIHCTNAASAPEGNISHVCGGEKYRPSSLYVSVHNIFWILRSGKTNITSFQFSYWHTVPELLLVFSKKNADKDVFRDSGERHLTATCYTILASFHTFHLIKHPARSPCVSSLVDELCGKEPDTQKGNKVIQYYCCLSNICQTSSFDSLETNILSILIVQ